MSRAQKLVVLLRLLPPQWLGAFAWNLARAVALDADRSIAAALEERDASEAHRREIIDVLSDREAMLAELRARLKHQSEVDVARISEAGTIRATLDAVYALGWQALVERHVLFEDALESRKVLSAEKMARAAAVGATVKATADRAALHKKLIEARDERDAKAVEALDWKARAEKAELEAKGLRAEKTEERETKLVTNKAACAWCLEDVGDSRWRVGLYPRSGVVRLCNGCGASVKFTADDIRARVAARAASCPSRRWSPDPLAVECAPGCGAPNGERCAVPGPP